MFTLQILDRGQTLLYTPPAEAVTIGSGDSADQRLREAGVEDEHLRLEPTADGMRLIALGPVKVNGEAATEVELQLGDRIEVGRAVLVVGQSVVRPAGPDDVLDGPAIGGSRCRSPQRSRLPLVLVGLAFVIAGAVAFLNRGDEREVDGEIALIASNVDGGQLERARRHIARCRREWAGATDDRLQRLDAEEQRVAAITEAAAALEQRVLDPASGSYAVWIKELRRIEAQGTPPERVAARLQLASLRETLERRPAAPAPVMPDPPAVADSDDPPPPVAPKDRTAETTAILADADRLAEQGLFAQAIAVVESELGEADAVAVTRLRERLASLRTDALGAMRELLAVAATQAEAGEPGDAITTLALAQHRFPGGGDFAELGLKLREFEAAAAAAERTSTPTADDAGRETVPTVRRTAGIAALRAQLDKIRDAEAAGGFEMAATLLRGAVELARERDPDFATRLERRAEVAALRAGFHELVEAALASDRRLIVALHSGSDAVLESVEGTKFVAGSERVAWRDISAAGLVGLAQQVGVDGRAAVGAATLIYEAGDQVAAERLLATALRADESLKPAVDRALADGRGDRFDPRGYVLGKDGFVSQREIELQKDIKRIASRIDGVFRKRDRQARDEFVAELLADGPDALDAIGFAFQQDLDKQIARLEASALKKQIDRLATQREALDNARTHALELIYDEQKYFYPYRPPAVSGDRHAVYNRVQAEVNRRIDTVRRLWRDDRLEVSLPRTLRTTLDRIDWTTRVLQQVGAFDGVRMARLEWVRALPIGRSIGITDYCKTVAEREHIDEWRRIAAYNKTVGRELSSSVRELLRITNDYRTMFRHRPLAVSPLVCSAAQGHAEEMSRLGYFAHSSPTPGRRTPFDRMKLAGYGFGVSENLALNGSAQGAHNSWLGSSGHHRNLLNPRHREMGIGVDGRNWVENFGGGSTYTEHPAYLEAESR